MPPALLKLRPKALYKCNYYYSTLLCAMPRLLREYIIQMMQGSEWTLKYDEPKVENVHIFNRGSSYFDVVRTTCFICFVVWPTTSLKLYIIF